MSEEDRQRILRIEIPPFSVGKAVEDPTWTDLTNANGWVVLDQAPGLPGTVMAWNGTIDLSGYARDYKTFYPQGGVIQQGPMVQETNGGGLILYTVVSSTPISPDSLQWQLAMGGPGFLNSGPLAGAGLGTDQQDPATIMFAESRLYVPNINIAPNLFGIQQPLESHQSGSLEPTASATLYVVAMYWPIEQGMTGAVIPAQRVILPGTMNQEPELEYMMRLARSVELANQV